MFWNKRKSTTTKSEFLAGENIIGKIYEKYRKVRDILHNIVGQNNTNNYTLPKIVVIGAESSGKSSLLENIVKCQLFPRDCKLCTKCPIHLKMENGESKYSVEYYEKGWSFPKTVHVQDKNSIYEIVNDYMKKIGDDTISELPFTINIRDENIPTMEFYDLPGIRSYPPDIAEMTMKLSEKYLSDPNIIVLCVVPASVTRLTSSQSIATVMKMGLEKKCILSLTMIDRLQPENIEELLIKRIIQTSDEISSIKFASVTAVINRTHNDTVDLVKQNEIESEWFEKNIVSEIPEEYEVYGNIIKGNVTVGKLIQHVKKLYEDFMTTDWKPRILKEILEVKKKVIQEYKQIGPEEVDFQEMCDHIWGSISELYTQISSKIEKIAGGHLLEFLDIEDDVLQTACPEYIRQILTELDLNKNNPTLENKIFGIQSLQYQTDPVEILEEDSDIIRKVHFENDLIKNAVVKFCDTMACYFTEVYDKISSYDYPYCMNRFEKIHEIIIRSQYALVPVLFQEYIGVLNHLNNEQYCDTITDEQFNERLENTLRCIIMNLSYSKIRLSEKDFEESQTTVSKRNALMEKIDKIQDHYEEIDSLF